jgi:hypothetical protein
MANSLARVVLRCRVDVDMTLTVQVVGATRKRRRRAEGAGDQQDDNGVTAPTGEGQDQDQHGHQAAEEMRLGPLMRRPQRAEVASDQQAAVRPAHGKNGYRAPPGQGQEDKDQRGHQAAAEELGPQRAEGASDQQVAVRANDVNGSPPGEGQGQDQDQHGRQAAAEEPGPQRHLPEPVLGGQIAYVTTAWGRVFHSGGDCRPGPGGCVTWRQ